MALGFKTGGRSAGTPNKASSELKAHLTEILTAELESIPTLLASLPPEERINAIIKLVGYVIPKPMPMNEGEGNRDIEITLNLQDDTKKVLGTVKS